MRNRARGGLQALLLHHRPGPSRWGLPWLPLLSDESAPAGLPQPGYFRVWPLVQLSYSGGRSLIHLASSLSASPIAGSGNREGGSQLPEQVAQEMTHCWDLKARSHAAFEGPPSLRWTVRNSVRPELVPDPGVWGRPLCLGQGWPSVSHQRRKMRLEPKAPEEVCGGGNPRGRVLF